LKISYLMLIILYHKDDRDHEKNSPKVQTQIQILVLTKFDEIWIYVGFYNNKI